jgi:WD40 repeat protein
VTPPRFAFQSHALRSNRLVQAIDVRPGTGELVVGQGKARGRQANLTLWSLPDFKWLQDVGDAEDMTAILMARFSPDGTGLVYIDTRMEPRLYDLESHRTVDLAPDNPSVQWISFAAKRNRLALSGELAQVWDLEERRLVWSQHARIAGASPEDPPPLACLDSSGQLVALVGSPDFNAVYAVSSRDVQTRLADAPDTIRSIEFSPDDQLIAALQYFGHGVTIWEASSGQRRFEDLFEDGPFLSLRFHPGGKHLAVGMASGYVTLADLRTGDYVVDAKAHEGRVWDIAFTADGGMMLSGGDDGRLCSWDLRGL